MKNKNLMQFKVNNNDNSSFDSENFEKSENYTERIKNKEEINKIKEKLKIMNNDNLSYIFGNQDTVNWNLVYSKIFHSILTNNNITTKEIELRINSVLNNQQAKEVNKPIKNSLLIKNKYEFKDKTKFVTTVMSKFNIFEADEGFSKDRVKNPLKKLMSANKPRKSENDRRKSTIMNKDLINKLMFSKGSSITKNDKNAYNNQRNSMKEKDFLLMNKNSKFINNNNIDSKNIKNESFEFERVNENFKLFLNVNYIF